MPDIGAGRYSVRRSLASSVFIISSLVFLLSSCSGGRHQGDMKVNKAISFSSPNPVWQKESADALSKYYPPIKDGKILISPVCAYTEKKTGAVIVVSDVSTDKPSENGFEESKRAFSGKKTKRQIIRDDYSANGLSFSHFLIDGEPTVSRIYVSDSKGQPEHAAIVDFICSPKDYTVLSSDFRKFVLSFSFSGEK